MHAQGANKKHTRRRKQAGLHLRAESWSGYLFVFNSMCREENMDMNTSSLSFVARHTFQGSFIHTEASARAEGGERGRRMQRKQKHGLHFYSAPQYPLVLFLMAHIRRAFAACSLSLTFITVPSTGLAVTWMDCWCVSRIHRQHCGLLCLKLGETRANLGRQTDTPRRGGGKGKREGHDSR